MRAFFDRFEQASDALDVDTIATKFAEVFMNADPNGVATVPRDAFLAALPQRQKLFDRMGVSDIRLTELSESRLDDNSQRAAILNDPSAPPLALSSSLILRQNGDSLALVFYVNHQDVMALAPTAEAAELAKVWPACSVRFGFAKARTLQLRRVNARRRAGHRHGARTCDMIAHTSTRCTHLWAAY